MRYILDENCGYYGNRNNFSLYFSRSEKFWLANCRSNLIILKNVVQTIKHISSQKDKDPLGFFTASHYLCS